MTNYHPCKNDKGQFVELKHPSQPTELNTWGDAVALATTVPESAMPSMLNGIAIALWKDAPKTVFEWEQLAEASNFDEPAFKANSGKKPASGAVAVEPDGRVWVVSPSNKYGGYTNTFPKGKIEPSEQLSLKANALKEVFEESGLQVVLTCFLCDSERDTTTTRYYLARRIGGNPAKMSWESQAVHLVPRGHLATFVPHPNDLAILKAIDTLVPTEKPSALSVTDISTNSGGNLTRLREGVRRFKEEYGSWPTVLAVGTRTLESLLHEHLTALGYGLLAQRLSILPQVKHDQILVTDNAGNQFDYSTDAAWNEQLEVTTEDVDQWIWGINLK